MVLCVKSISYFHLKYNTIIQAKENLIPLKEKTLMTCLIRYQPGTVKTVNIISRNWPKILNAIMTVFHN